jgi:hypothetical protein
MAPVLDPAHASNAIGAQINSLRMREVHMGTLFIILPKICECGIKISFTIQLIFLKK